MHGYLLFDEPTQVFSVEWPFGDKTRAYRIIETLELYLCKEMSKMVQIKIPLAMYSPNFTIAIWVQPKKLMIFLIVLPQPGGLGRFEITNIAQIFHFLVHSQDVPTHVPLVSRGGFTLITSICQNARIFFSLIINFLFYKFLLLPH